MNLEPEILYINVEDIIPNRFQPRLTFDESALNELALSIKEHGIIQPLVLRKLSNDKYEIIAGERRYKASQIAGLNKVPAIISNMDDNTSAEVALVENLQRKNLSSIEEAKSYKKLLDRGYLTQEDLAKKMGISQSSIANKVRLLNLTEEVQNALMNEKISERHARSLLQLKNSTDQIDMLNKIINNRLTVRQLDIEIDKLNKKDTIQESVQEDFSNNNINSQNDEDLSEEDRKLIDLIISSKKTDNINNTENNDDDNFEVFDIPTVEETEVVEEEKQEEKKDNNRNSIESGNFNSVIKTIDNLKTEIKEAGFKIETEDYDFEDLYQIIIKIEK